MQEALRADPGDDDLNEQLPASPSASPKTAAGHLGLVSLATHRITRGGAHLDAPGSPVGDAREHRVKFGRNSLMLKE